jgi:hypothetical protein
MNPCYTETTPRKMDRAAGKTSSSVFNVSRLCERKSEAEVQALTKLRKNAKKRLSLCTTL